MARLRLLALGISLPCLLWAALQDLAANTVGYESQWLKQGENEIKVNFDYAPADSTFTTLDKVIKFEPKEGVVGDELIFDLDGFRQCYRFEGYDSTGDVYRLVRSAETGSLPQTISLAAIPLPEKFKVNHRASTNVAVIAAGVLANEYKRIAESWNAPMTNMPPITVRIVAPGECGAQSRNISFEKGRIEVR